MNRLAVEDVWQRCPICEGKGEIPNAFSVFNNSWSQYVTCPTCYGDRLISRLTGYPRSYEINARENSLPPEQPSQESIDKTYEDFENCKWAETNPQEQSDNQGIIASNGLQSPEYEVKI